MSSWTFQRATVLVLAVASGVAALGIALVLHHNLNAQRSDRVDDARRHIADALRARAYYLEDVADMVGVHDDADATEFSRYAHVRGRNESSVVGVQWLRRSPTGRLQPPRETGPSPILVPGSGPNAELVDAARADTAQTAVRIASHRKRVAVSAPVELAGGHSGFYLAVPVEARRFSGEVSRMESRSAIVGLIDAQKLIAEANSRRALAPLRLGDGSTSLATIGSEPYNGVQSSLAAGARRWTLTVDGGALSTLEQALPWLVFSLGFGLTLAVALSLRQAGRRRDAALRLARDRSDELSITLRTVERANQDLEQARAEADRLSRVDPLTGLFNRRHFTELLVAEQTLTGSGSAAVLLLDLDHFKSVNDRYGHRTGDAVLQAAAERIASITRASDCLARWGGEEFAIFAPGVDTDDAILLAERARAALADRPVEVDDLAIELTLSVGLAVVGSETRTPDRLVDAADEALYEAKRSGRNCVRVFQEAYALLGDERGRLGGHLGAAADARGEHEQRDE
jgi:diguanylate cyclase (GGDEF)-like protein